MSDNLKKHFRDLEFINKIKDKKVKKNLLKYISKNPKIYLAIKEIGLNVIEGNIKTKLSIKNKKYLTNFKKKKSLTQCKKIVQTGGWLWLIPIAITAYDIIKNVV